MSRPLWTSSCRTGCSCAPAHSRSARGAGQGAGRGSGRGGAWEARGGARGGAGCSWVRPCTCVSLALLGSQSQRTSAMALVISEFTWGHCAFACAVCPSDPPASRAPPRFLPGSDLRACVWSVMRRHSRALGRLAARALEVRPLSLRATLAVRRVALARPCSGSPRSLKRTQSSRPWGVHSLAERGPVWPHGLHSSSS